MERFGFTEGTAGGDGGKDGGNGNLLGEIEGGGVAVES